jgi:hypothetical protein
MGIKNAKLTFLYGLVLLFFTIIYFMFGSGDGNLIVFWTLPASFMALFIGYMLMFDNSIRKKVILNYCFTIVMTLVLLWYLKEDLFDFADRSHEPNTWSLFCTSGMFLFTFYSVMFQFLNLSDLLAGSIDGK